MQKKLLSTLITSACLLSANSVANAADFPYLLPDFTVSNFVFTDNLDTGTTTISLTVKNNSLESYSTQRSPLYLTMSTGTSLNDAEVILNNKYIDPLGDYGFRTYSWETNSDILSKNLYVTLDPYEIIEEINENNNDAVAVRQEPIGSGAIELESTISTDAVGGAVTIGDSLGIQLATVASRDPDDVLSGIVTVTDANGVELFVSDLIELSNGSAQMSYEGYYNLDTSDFEPGALTLTFSVWGYSSGKLDDVSMVVSLQSVVENNPPNAVDDIASTVMDQSVEIDIQFNDVEPDGNGYIHYISSEPAHGEVEVLRGVATYTPEPGFVGADQFSYQMNDYSGASDWAIVTVDVLPPENGCTWIRDFEVVTSTEKTAVDGWSDYNLPEDGRAENAAFVEGNTNPDLFDVQPFISFPSCSLYFQPKAGATGTATVVYKVLDKETEGEEYTSEPRSFEITLAPEATLPEFVSTPVTIAQVNTAYTYTVELSDDTGTLTAIELPDFLTLENGIISGTPDDTSSNVGMHKVTLVVDNGVQSATQEFLLTVEPELSAASSGESMPLADDSSSDGQPNEPSEILEKPVILEDATVETGGAGGFNILWLLLSLPLLRRLR